MLVDKHYYLQKCVQEAWPRAKTAAMGADVKVGQFGQPQGGLWTREQAKAWLEAECAGAKARVEAKTRAGGGVGKDKGAGGNKGGRVDEPFGYVEAAGKTKDGLVPDTRRRQGKGRGRARHSQGFGYGQRSTGKATDG